MCHADLPAGVQTPEPWAATGQYLLNREIPSGPCHPIYSEDGSDPMEAGRKCREFYGGVLVAESMRTADAERAAACVNALKGVPTAALAEGWVTHALALLGDAWTHIHETRSDTELEERLRRFILLNRATVVSRAIHTVSPTHMCEAHR